MTNAQYARFVWEMGQTDWTQPAGKCDNPVVKVNWEDGRRCRDSTN